MDSHFVEGHLGGYYISDNDPKLIEEICEECGDYDRIIFSFDDEDKEEPYKSFSEFLISELIFTKEKLEAKLYSYDAFNKGIKKAVSEIKEDLLFDIDDNKDMLRVILENGDIDKKTYNKLIRYLNQSLKKQYEYLDSFDYTTINLKEYSNKLKRKKR